jgi:hypothetical protein
MDELVIARSVSDVAIHGGKPPKTWIAALRSQ